jgi:hypothetical protein
LKRFAIDQKYVLKVHMNQKEWSTYLVTIDKKNAFLPTELVLFGIQAKVEAEDR